MSEKEQKLKQRNKLTKPSKAQQNKKATLQINKYFLQDSTVISGDTL